MTVRFIYSTEPDRLISAIIMESKPSIPTIKGKSGFETKAYVDEQLYLVQQNNALVYNLANFNGNMIGYIAISVTNMGLNAVKIQQVVRSNFKSMESEILQQITTFINNGGWRGDYLL